MRKKIPDILDHILTGLALLAIVLAILNNLVFKTYTLESGSMEPAYQVGALVTIMPGVMPKVGNVASFATSTVAYKQVLFIKVPEYSGTPVIHRVIRIDKDGNYIFQGDACKGAEQIVSPDRIIGKELYHTNLAAPLLRLLHGEQTTGG